MKKKRKEAHNNKNNNICVYVKLKHWTKQLRQCTDRFQGIRRTPTFPFFCCEVRQIEYNQAFDDSGPGMYKKKTFANPDVTFSCQG